jgi:uncharacterized membrane protein YdjX (TVP38/TMEM64 family)
MKNIGKVLLGSLFVAALVAFVAFDGPRHLTFDTLSTERDVLVHFADAHLLAAILLTFGAYAGAVALSIPGGALFCLACGLMFGRVLGTAVAVAAACFGATLIFVAARYLFGGVARRYLPDSAQRLTAGFARHAFLYLLVLRVVPLFPFFLVNLVPALTSIRVSTYVGATLLGIIPATFVYANLGDALAYADSLQSAISTQTLLPIVILAILAIAPLIVSARRRFTAGLHAK